ncbi:MAG: nuclear transport factor 2 family protein [Verrucomicrobia bacterium]|nr:nuclear transport factor 2 family protein [Verrucomicrobiota bacterium]
MSLSSISPFPPGAPWRVRPETSPVDIVREGYARFAHRNAAAVLALLSPDVEITQTSDVPWGGRFRGHAGALEFFARLDRYTDATPDPIITVPAGRDVAVVGRLRGKVRATGRALDLVVVHLWSIRGGEVVRFAAYADAPAVRETFELP